MPDHVEKPSLSVSVMPVYQWFRSEEGNANITVWNYLNMRGDLELAVGFSKLFYPDFVEVEGCVLLSVAYSPDSYQRWKKALNGDRSHIETMLNYTRVWELFLGPTTLPPAVIIDESTTSALSIYLGKVLAICWRHALHDAFPEKTFNIVYDESYHDPSVTFYQI